MIMTQPQRFIREAYRRLYKRFGPQHWWPGETKFEIIVGAILTQNTNWSNVTKAIENLKKAGVLSPEKLYRIPVKKLSSLIKPAGYFNVKARRLKSFMDFFFKEYQGKVIKMSREDGPALRRKLLNVHGIGPETADSILLYACDKPAFVVDAYTKRIFYRHNIVESAADYHRLQKMITDHLKEDVPLFNEYHALIVRVGKDFCKPTPRCAQCPLNDLHYSLIYKCRHCHRFLSSKELTLTRGPRERQFVCCDCRQSVK